jgi:hypothetical protein
MYVDAIMVRVLGRIPIYYIILTFSLCVYYVNKNSTLYSTAVYLSNFSRFLMLCTFFIWPFLCSLREGLFAGFSHNRTVCGISSLVVIGLLFISSLLLIYSNDYSPVVAFFTAFSALISVFIWYNISFVYIKKSAARPSILKVLSYMAIFLIMPFVAPSFQADLKGVRSR